MIFAAFFSLYALFLSVATCLFLSFTLFISFSLSVCVIPSLWFTPMIFKSGHSCMQQTDHNAPLDITWAFSQKFHSQLHYRLCECDGTNKYLEIVISILSIDVLETTNQCQYTVWLDAFVSKRFDQREREREKEKSNRNRVEWERKMKMRKKKSHAKSNWTGLSSSMLFFQYSPFDRISMAASFAACKVVTLHVISIELIAIQIDLLLRFRLCLVSVSRAPSSSSHFMFNSTK